MKLVRGCLVIVGVVFVAVLVIMLLDKVIPSKVIRELPDGATEIQEFYKDSGFTGDFRRLLKARIPEDQVAGYARRLGAVSKEAGGAGHEYFSWSSGPSWFDPNSAPRFYFYEPQYRVLVGWEDGFVYFDEVAW